MNAPIAPKRSDARTLHGETVDDPWSWLRDKESSEVISHIERENAYAQAVMEPTQELQGRIFDEIKGRTLETDLAVPAQRGNFWYTTRTEEGESYAIRVRMSGGPDGDEQLVLDENAEAAGEEYFRLGNLAVSHDHRFVAYSVDTDGSEAYTTRIREIDSQTNLDDVLTECRYGLAWSKDGRFVFYVVADSALRPYQIWRHEIGTEQASDVIVLHEEDDRFYLDMGTTRSTDYIVISSDSAVTESAWVIPTANPTETPREVIPRVAGVQYTIDHRGELFWVVTNDLGADGRVVTVPTEGGPAKEVVAHERGVKLVAPMCFADHVLVWGRTEGLPAVFRLEDEALARILFDEPVYTVSPEANHQFASDTIRYSFESFITPRSIIDHNLVTGDRTTLKRMPVLGEFDSEDYRQERIWAPAADGTQIPISFVRHRDTPVDSTAPLLLYAYGAYEISMPAHFSIARLSLLDRGVSYAIAHVRGGGEMGKAWYEGGKLSTKANTFSDFVDAARALGSSGHADPDRIAARGASAGGLTMGAAMNLDPTAFAAVVAEVPFVDVTNTMLDVDLPLTVVEWEEWGNPQVFSEYGWISEYCPYENVSPNTYPPVLATAGLNDPRVSYWEPAKWVQRLREQSTSGNEIVLKTEMTAGHFARSGRYDLWEDEAFVLAFVLTRLGV